MKSKVKFIIIIAAVLLILCGAMVVLLLTKPADEETDSTDDSSSSPTSTLLYDKNPRDINTLTITNATSSYKVERVGEGDEAMWTIFEYLSAPVDGNMIDKLLKSAATMTAQKVASENAADLSIYGLDKPQAEFKAELTDSSKTVIDVLIGNVTPLSSQVYMCFKGENKVYTVSSSDVSCFLQDKTDCISKTLYTQYTPTDTSDTTDYTRINKMTISRKDIDYDIVIGYDTRLDNPDIVISNSSSYRMTSPVMLDLNPDKCTNVIQGVLGLTADKFDVINPTEDQLKEYGLDDPFATVTMDIVGGKFAMKIGNTFNDEDGKQAGYYVIVDGINVIYELSTDKLPWVTLMPLDITTSMITSNYVYSITSMDISGSGLNQHYEMTGSSEKDYTVKLDGTDMDVASFRTFYQFILKAPAEQLCFDDVSGEPSAKITIKTTNGTDVLEFYPSANRRSIIRLNGKSCFSCKTAYAERLIENAKKFKNGEDLILSW